MIKPHIFLFALHTAVAVAVIRDPIYYAHFLSRLQLSCAQKNKTLKVWKKSRIDCPNIFFIWNWVIEFSWSSANHVIWERLPSPRNCEEVSPVEVRTGMSSAEVYLQYKWMLSPMMYRPVKGKPLTWARVIPLSGPIQREQYRLPRIAPQCSAAHCSGYGCSCIVQRAVDTNRLSAARCTAVWLSAWLHLSYGRHVTAIM